MEFWIIIRKGPTHHSERWYTEQVLNHHNVKGQYGTIFYDSRINISDEAAVAAYLVRAVADFNLSIENASVSMHTYDDGDGYEGVIVVAKGAKKQSQKKNIHGNFNKERSSYDDLCDICEVLEVDPEYMINRYTEYFKKHRTDDKILAYRKINELIIEDQESIPDLSAIEAKPISLDLKNTVQKRLIKLQPEAKTSFDDEKTNKLDKFEEFEENKTSSKIYNILALIIIIIAILLYFIFNRPKTIIEMEFQPPKEKVGRILPNHSDLE